MNLQKASMAKKNVNGAQKLPNMLCITHSFLFLQHYSYAQGEQKSEILPVT